MRSVPVIPETTSAQAGALLAPPLEVVLVYDPILGGAHVELRARPSRLLRQLNRKRRRP